MSRRTAGVQVDEALVPAAPEPQGDVLQLLHEAAVHQHVQQGQELVRHLAAGVGAVGGQFLVGKAGEGPDVFLRVGGPDPAQEGHQHPLVFRFEGFAAQERQAVDVAGGEQLQEVLLCFLREGLAVFKIPGLGLEAVFAVVGAAGDEQRHPDALAIGDVAVFDLTVIHV